MINELRLGREFWYRGAIKAAYKIVFSVARVREIIFHDAPPSALATSRGSSARADILLDTH